MAKTQTLGQRFGILLIVFGIIALFVVGQTVVSIQNNSKCNAQMQVLAKRSLPSINTIALLTQGTLSYESVNLRFMFAEDDKQMDALKAEAKSIEQDILDSWTNLQGYMDSSELSTYKASIDSKLAKMQETSKAILIHLQKKEMFEAGQLFSKDALPLFKEIRSKIDELKDHLLENSATAVQSTEVLPIV